MVEIILSNGLLAAEVWGQRRARWPKLQWLDFITRPEIFWC